MREYRIALMPGDGIGREVCPEGVRVMDAAADLFGFRLRYETFDWGCEYYLQRGEMMPADALDLLAPFDAIYFGAVGFPTVPDHISLHGLLLPIRQAFEQYANVRPSLLLPGVPCPLRDKAPGAIDFVVVRENTEGEYAGAGGRIHRGHPLELAVETAIFTREGVERVVRFAAGLAMSRPRKTLVNVTKSNAQRHSMVLWDEVFERVVAEYPALTTERVLVDAMAARFALKPESLDVLVASNLFADILTDLGSAICGSMGLAPSANINPERKYPSLFEPVHGSAPDIAGRGIANPIAAVWSAAMMLDFLGEKPAADLIMAAIKSVTAAGRVLTPDLGGHARTADVGAALTSTLRGLADAPS
jgi:tartrate dehydrogenase/decarboxylase/D-malate dehydrogenase